MTVGTRERGVQIHDMLDNAKHRRKRMESMDLLADTRRYLDDAIRQLEEINAGIPIAEPLTRDEAINIVTEKIGLFESVLRRYRKIGTMPRGPKAFSASRLWRPFQERPARPVPIFANGRPINDNPVAFLHDPYAIKINCRLGSHGEPSTAYGAACHRQSKTPQPTNAKTISYTPGTDSPKQDTLSVDRIFESILRSCSVNFHGLLSAESSANIRCKVSRAA